MFVHPQFDPIAISIGPLAVRWYGLMYLVAFILFVVLGRAHARRRPELGWTPQQIDDLLFYGVLGVILGGRLGYVLFYKPAYYLAHPAEILAVWQGGMAFHGGFLGVLVAMWLFGRRTNRPWLAVTDFIAPLVPLGLAAGRMGNFINGELVGRVTDVPWAMVFPQVDGLARHPSQLYQFALEGVVLFIILNLFWRKNPPRGAISGMFLLFYGLFRFLVEFVRQPDSQLGLYFQEISMGQILSTPMIIAGALMIWVAYKRPQLFGNAGKEVKQ